MSRITLSEYLNKSITYKPEVTNVSDVTVVLRRYLHNPLIKFEDLTTLPEALGVSLTAAKNVDYLIRDTFRQFVYPDTSSVVFNDYLDLLKDHFCKNYINMGLKDTCVSLMALSLPDLKDEVQFKLSFCGLILTAKGIKTLSFNRYENGERCLHLLTTEKLNIPKNLSLIFTTSFFDVQYTLQTYLYAENAPTYTLIKDTFVVGVYSKKMIPLMESIVEYDSKVFDAIRSECVQLVKPILAKYTNGAPPTTQAIQGGVLTTQRYHNLVYPLTTPIFKKYSELYDIILTDFQQKKIVSQLISSQYNSSPVEEVLTYPPHGTALRLRKVKNKDKLKSMLVDICGVLYNYKVTDPILKFILSLPTTPAPGKESKVVPGDNTIMLDSLTQCFNYIYPFCKVDYNLTLETVRLFIKRLTKLNVKNNKEIRFVPDLNVLGEMTYVVVDHLSVWDPNRQEGKCFYSRHEDNLKNKQYKLKHYFSI